MSDDGLEPWHIVGGIAALGVFGIAWLWYSGSDSPAPTRTIGLDQQTTLFVQRETPALAPPETADEPAAESSLGMLRSRGEFSGAAASSAARPDSSPSSAGSSPGGASPAKSPAARAQETMIRNDSQMRSFVQRMMRKYPSVAQYDKDWSSYPDLKKLQNDYWKDRDVAKFLVGVAKSDNFGKMMRKYAADPGVRGFAMEFVTAGPKEVVGSIGELSGSDGAIKKVMSGVMEGLGIPSSVASTLMGGGKPEEMDTQKMTSEILKSNPALKSLPPDVQAQLQKANLQQNQGR